MKQQEQSLDDELALEVLDLWQHDIWSFVRDACWTIDEADSGAVKRFPDLPYLQRVCEAWQEHKMLVIPKSRRMMLTWVMLAIHLHLALFTPNSAIFIQSKKADDSDYLLGDNRMLFIYRHLPSWLHDYGLPTATRRQYHVHFSNGSMVKGIAQGPDQLRQYTATAIMCDEIAFWEQATTTWRAIRPVLQGGGRATLISSAAPGFFANIVHGRLKDA